MANFVTPDKTASRPFSPGGIYFGTVTRVDDSLNRVYVKIPRFVTNAEFGPLAVVGPELPVVGDRVGCLFMENRTDDIVVIGVVKNQSMLPTAPVVVATSTTHPDSPKVGTILYETDTEDVYVWNGTEWLTFFEVNLPATIYADLQGTAASATFAITAASATTATSATIASSVADDSVVLGNDTTGDYVGTITAGTGVSVSPSGTGEGSTPTIAIGQSVATSATPSFSTIASTVATGTSPLTVASTTLVSNLNADRLDGEHGSWYAPSGIISPYAGLSAPSGWIFCDGSSVSRTTYASLWSTLSLSKGAVTSISNPGGLVTLTGHGLAEGDAIYFTTTGTLPTGLSVNTIYYVKFVSVNTFNVATTRTATAASGAAASFTTSAAVTVSSAGTGTHTVIQAPYGIPAGSTTNFLLPDMRGRTPVGLDNINGTDAGVLTIPNAVGATSGSQTHTLLTAELAQHAHANTLTDPGHGHTIYGVNSVGSTNAFGIASMTVASSDSNKTAVSNTTGITITNANAGSNGAHNNMQPFMLVNYIIKT
jgi:microcystin-dependent protein